MFHKHGTAIRSLVRRVRTRITLSDRGWSAANAQVSALMVSNSTAASPAQRRPEWGVRDAPGMGKHPGPRWRQARRCRVGGGIHHRQGRSRPGVVLDVLLELGRELWGEGAPGLADRVHEVGRGRFFRLGPCRRARPRRRLVYREVTK